MGPQCLPQKSVWGIEGNNIGAVSWLWIPHTLGTKQMFITWVSMVFKPSSTLASHPWRPSMLVSADSKFPQKLPEVGSSQPPEALRSGVGRPHSPAFPCAQTSPRVERTQASPGDDNLALETRSVHRKHQGTLQGASS